MTPSGRARPARAAHSVKPPRKSETPRTTAYTDPPGELVLGARHAGMYTAAQGGLSAVSVAHTWHAVMDCHPTAVAGEEGIVTLHVGQPSKACVVSVEIEPTSKRAKLRHAEENLKRDYNLAHPSLKKGEHVRLVFGPCMAAGPHLLSVTLNGAHVAGSPYTLAVRRGGERARCGGGCEARRATPCTPSPARRGVGLLDRQPPRRRRARGRGGRSMPRLGAPEAVAAADSLWSPAEPPALDREAAAP